MARDCRTDDEAVPKRQLMQDRYINRIKNDGGINRNNFKISQKRENVFLIFSAKP